MNEQYPEAPAELRQANGIYQWAVRTCPLCGRQHVHGGGLVGRDDPDDALGHRVAHCGNGGGYVLTRDGHVTDG